MRVRTVALTAVVALALAGCGWTQPDFDAGHDRTNPLETSLTTQNVGSLTQHSVSVAGHPVTSFFVVRNWIVVNTDAGATAFDRAACPRNDNGACTPVWTRPGAQFRSSDGITTMFFSTGLNTFDAVDFSGHKLWSGVAVADPLYPGPGSFGTNAFTIAGSNVFVPLDVYAGHMNRSSTMNVFRIAGCGSSSCGPASQYDRGLSPSNWPDPFGVADNRLVTGFLTGARDLASGAVLWSGSGVSVPTLAHGREVYAITPSPFSFQVFDVDGVRNCSGTPTVCQPIRALETDQLYAVSDALAVGRLHLPAGTALGFFTTDGTACSGAPLICLPTATTTTLGSEVTAAVLTTRLVFAVGQDQQGSHLAVFDALQRAGCAGSPKVCSPLADLRVSTHRVLGPVLDGLEVWDGHVYALTDDGVVHVFAFPST